MKSKKQKNFEKKSSLSNKIIKYENDNKIMIITV